MLELDVGPSSPERLRFTVLGMVAPAVVVQATLRFDSYDADHPGQEGRIWVNGVGPYDLPADASWDNRTGFGAVDVTGATVEGTNQVEFGPGPMSRSFYRIGNVVIEAIARVESCPPPPDPPPVERTVHYRDATYTNRHNWVLRCDDYAFTAHSTEHLGSDCDGLYSPDGSRRGTATFAFPAVAPGLYDVLVRSRHSTNRNPLGALFIVNGEERRIDQRASDGHVTDTWGRSWLDGGVTVVLDSSRESESDSVIWVRLQPAE